jgi:MFS family permease
MDISETAPAPIAIGAVPARDSFLGLTAFASLRHRDFRVLWLGMLLSSSTIMFQWFAVGRLIEDHFPRTLGESFPILLMLGMAGLTRGLGMFIFSIPGGALADRYDRRNLSIMTQVAGIAFAATFSLLIALDLIQLWHVFLLLFATAAAQTFDLPARQALIPQLVEMRDITNAVALFTAAMQTSFAFSPLLAGYFLDTLGLAGTYGASIVGHLVLLLALLMVRPRGRAAETHEGILRQVRDGIRYARHNHAIFGVLAVSFIIFAIGMSVIINLSPFWILRVLEASPTTWGILATVWGVGAVSTSYFLSSLGSFRQKGKLFLGAALGFSALFVLWGIVHSPVWFSVTQFFMAVCLSTLFVSGTAIVQTIAPNEVRGRVMSLFGLSQAIAMASGIAVGAIAEVAGATNAVPVMGLVLLAAICCAYLALPRLRTVD